MSVRIHSLRIGGIIASLLLSSYPALCFNNGVARLPPMGWSSYNGWGGYWTDKDILANADSMATNGLRECGYVYINIDGSNKGDTPYFPGKPGFVAWAKPLGDYVHAKGLKFGVYMMTTTNPTQTAQDCLNAGVDFVKHDDWMLSPTSPLWKNMHDALAAVNRQIVYSVHAVGDAYVDTTYVHMWRTGLDIARSWSVIMQDFDANYSQLGRSGPGHWADPDMLEVGNITNNGWFTLDEDQAHFSMWCMMGAPLIAGYDFSKTNSAHPTMEHHIRTVAIHANTELIAVDQDTLAPGRRIKGQGALEVWVKDLQDGTKAVALFNRTTAASAISVSQTDLGWTSAAQIYVRDLWTHQDLAPFTGTVTRSVNTHGVAVYKMSTTPIGQQTKILQKMDRSIAWLAGNGYDVFPRRMIPGLVTETDPRTMIFDVRGRMPQSPGSSLLILRYGPGRDARRIVWPGESR